MPVFDSPAATQRKINAAVSSLDADAIADGAGKVLMTAAERARLADQQIRIGGLQTAVESLSAGTGPGLTGPVVNYVRDPQIKNYLPTSDTIFNYASETATLPAGFSYGLRSTRTATGPTNVVAAYGLCGTGTAAVPITPGSRVSVRVEGVRTTATNARYRVDLYWYKEDGSAASTASLADNYANLAASTWVTWERLHVLAPADAAYCRPQIIVGLVSGVTAGGETAVATGLRIFESQGAGVSLAYLDGTREGYVWTGEPHASTTAESGTLSLAEVNTLKAVPSRVAGLEMAKRVSVSKVGSALAVSSALGASTLTINASLTASANGGFTFLSTTLGGSQIHTTNDSITPIRTQLGTVGGNHGYPSPGAFDNPDGKTAADLGSVWTDGTREYVLLAINAAGKLVVGGSYTTDGSGVTTSALVAPTVPLTHVSGAAHTGSIQHATRATTQLYPGVTRKVTTLWGDDQQITADGAYRCSELAVRETYEILDYAAIYDAAKANPGVSYATLNIAGCVLSTSTYRFLPGGLCRISIVYEELAPTELARCGGVQSEVMSKAGATITRYLPGVGTVGGVNWSAGVPLGAYSTDVVILSTQIPSVTAQKVPAVSVDVMSESGTPTVAFALGYLPYGTRGDESTTGASRLAEATAGGPGNNVLWDMRGTKKNYPNFVNKRLPGWGRQSVEAFFCYLTPSQANWITSARGSAAAFGAYRVATGNKD